jgi:hypothetical protein
VGVRCNIFGDCLPFRFHPLHSFRGTMVLLFSQILWFKIFRSNLLVYRDNNSLYQLIHSSFLWVIKLHKQLCSIPIIQNRHTADELWANTQYDLLKIVIFFIGSKEWQLGEGTIET